MPIADLQRQAFTASGAFNSQVNAVVTEQALYKNELWHQQGKLDTATRERLAKVVQHPSSYGFPSAIVNSNGWNISYDTWASDPAGADGAILSAIGVLWELLTGIEEPVAPQP